MILFYFTCKIAYSGRKMRKVRMGKVPQVVFHFYIFHTTPHRRHVPELRQEEPPDSSPRPARNCKQQLKSSKKNCAEFFWLLLISLIPKMKSTFLIRWFPPALSLPPRWWSARESSHRSNYSFG